MANTERVAAYHRQVAKVLTIASDVVRHIDWNSLVADARQLGAHVDLEFHGDATCTVTYWWYGDPDTAPCDECGAAIPSDAELVNRHHDAACSLHTRALVNPITGLRHRVSPGHVETADDVKARLAQDSTSLADDAASVLPRTRRQAAEDFDGTQDLNDARVSKPYLFEPPR